MSSSPGRFSIPFFSFRFFSVLMLMGIGMILIGESGNSSSYGGDRAPHENGLGVTLRDSLRALRKVPAGRALLNQAERAWKVSGDQALLEFIRLDSVSRTDAVLTRHFDPESGKEWRKRDVTVYIRKDQSFEDQTLDLAHELTHATAAPSWDPYDPALTAGKYVYAALEAPGGEVEAVFRECQVGLELARLNEVEDAAVFQITRCDRYLASTSAKPGKKARLELDRERVLKDFYRVGKYKAEVVSRLGEEKNLFPLLSTDKPELYSSTGKAPYPLALIREFNELNQVACENARRRVSTQSGSSLSLGSSGNSGKPGRTPASTHELLARRCAP